MAKQVNLEVSIAKENLDTIGCIDNLRDQYGKTYQFIQRESKPVGILYHSLSWVYGFKTISYD